MRGSAGSEALPASVPVHGSHARASRSSLSRGSQRAHRDALKPTADSAASDYLRGIDTCRKCAGSPPNACSGQVQTARSQEFHLRPLQGWQGPKHLGFICWCPRRMGGERKQSGAARTQLPCACWEHPDQEHTVVYITVLPAGGFLCYLHFAGQGAEETRPPPVGAVGARSTGAVWGKRLSPHPLHLGFLEAEAAGGLCHGARAGQKPGVAQGNPGLPLHWLPEKPWQGTSVPKAVNQGRVGRVLVLPSSTRTHSGSSELP